MQSKSQAPSITTGPITAQLLLFFFPILLGTFFQQLYNTVDTIIVGNFVGTNTALAAVGGATGQLVNLFVGFFIGLSSGCGVIISQYYGAKDHRAVSKSVHTALAFSLLSGVVIMVLGLALTNVSLRAMSLPEEIMPEASAYLRIFFLGMIPNLFYNMGAAVLRAIGDSKRPLYFLILSCLCNIVLDLIFVAYLRLGVSGAALATILSQLASAVMVLFVLLRTKSDVRLIPSQLRLELFWLKKMIYVGLPAGLQSTMYTVSNIIVQATINSFGTNTIAAVTAYGKMDVIFWMVINAFGIAITTFVGQNYGAGKTDRAFRGFRAALLLSAIGTLLLSGIIWLFGMNFLRFFTKDPDVLAICNRLIHFVVPFFITYIPIEICSGTLRGMGNSWMPMILTMLGVCVLRMFWIFLAVPLHRDILTLMTAYPISWITTSVALSLSLFLTRRRYLSQRSESEKSS
ncbi:MATE family efflux transporter [Stomatobaculum sp.]